jgi:hypothetical protein
VLHQPIAASEAEQTTGRSYTLTHKPQPDWSLRRGMDWTLQYFDGGKWRNTHLFTHEIDAQAAGYSWMTVGRMA